MGKIIAVGGMKGGAGKTTIATNLAGELATRGKRVLLVDGDARQGNATQFANDARPVLGSRLSVFSGDEHMTSTIPKVVDDFDYIVIDCPGHLNTVQRAALAVAELVIIPVRESKHDRTALASTAEELAFMNRKREERGHPPFTVLGVVSAVDLRRSVGERARQSLDQIGMRAARSPLSDRAEFVEAAEFGQPVTAYAPRSEAARELRALTDEVLATLGGKRKHGPKEVTAAARRKG